MGGGLGDSPEMINRDQCAPETAGDLENKKPPAWRAGGR